GRRIEPRRSAASPAGCPGPRAGQPPGLESGGNGPDQPGSCDPLVRLIPHAGETDDIHTATRAATDTGHPGHATNPHGRPDLQNDRPGNGKVSQLCQHLLERIYQVVPEAAEAVANVAPSVGKSTVHAFEG